MPDLQKQRRHLEQPSLKLGVPSICIHFVLLTRIRQIGSNNLFHQVWKLTILMTKERTDIFDFVVERMVYQNELFQGAWLFGQDLGSFLKEVVGKICSIGSIQLLKYF
eukprot:TRINITY_DN1869_c0_g1_i4.p4 TRINITY_DN1869_c0_g1~~TRINITY_DN1869_c0_g1_i4.p4  ORF type:complete len:108 (+),score=2.99 TRINITY_DN1869_c0_g1_i4:79-402(+)